jgi:hypothetical protein
MVLTLCGAMQDHRLPRLRFMWGADVLQANRMLSSESSGPWAARVEVGFMSELLAIGAKSPFAPEELTCRPGRLDWHLQPIATDLRLGAKVIQVQGVHPSIQAKERVGSRGKSLHR